MEARDATALYGPIAGRDMRCWVVRGATKPPITQIAACADIEPVVGSGVTGRGYPIRCVVRQDAVVSDLEWFRASSWDAEIAERFEARLRRARASNRAQYVRIQASHLLESSDASTRETGRALLRRVIDDHSDDDIQTKCAWEQLGDSLAREGRLGEAEGALRETLRRVHSSPTGNSGTSGTPELRLAEVLVARGDAASIDEAGQLLATVESAVRTHMFLRDVLYRYFLACARVAHVQRAPGAAAELARAALRVADDTSTPLPRHPTVGCPKATDRERAELNSIASAG